jgi:hypothetical protein
LLRLSQTHSISIVSAKVSVSALITLLLVSACGFEPNEDPAESTATTTHALIRVDRSALVGAEDEATGRAFAGIVRVPREVDPERLLSVSGMGLSLPAAGKCAATARERDVLADHELGRAEFVDAGDVLLGAIQAQTQLAPRAFPSSQMELLSGVVYTSRDQASAPFPGGARYLLKTSGSEQLAPLELAVDAPALLTDVRVEGSSLADVTELPSAQSLQVTWLAGDARDLVYVELTGEAGPVGVCSFQDSAGRGQLPSGLFGATGEGSLSFHRLREVAADVASLDAAEVRFDFELSAEVSFR